MNHNQYGAVFIAACNEEDTAVGPILIIKALKMSLLQYCARGCKLYKW